MKSFKQYLQEQSSIVDTKNIKKSIKEINYILYYKDKFGFFPTKNELIDSISNSISDDLGYNEKQDKIIVELENRLKELQSQLNKKPQSTMKPNNSNTSITSNPKFKKWFRGSKVVDSEGNPLVAFHGSGTEIEEFSYEFTNQGNDQLGSGFYFTTDDSEAKGYTSATTNNEPKLGGSNKPTVHAVYLSIKKPLDADKIGNVSRAKIYQIMKRSPELEDALWNWGDLGRQSKQTVMQEALPNYEIKDQNIVQGLFNLANDFFPNSVKEFNTLVNTWLGYDGVVKHHDGKDHWVAFFPNQIKSVNNKGTFNPDSNNINE